MNEEEQRLNIEFDVRGSRPIKFEEGWQTGDMTEPGLAIDTVWHEDGIRYGGCINQKEAIQLRNFLNECIKLWGKE